MAEEDEGDCCPLCMEELDLTDKTFDACPCGYQVCLWCWHQIKNEYNGLCPACRAPYSELSKQKSSLDREDVLRRTKQRKQKEKSERRTASQSRIPTVNRKNLANVRVMQRNLVYVIGLPQHFAEEEILRSNECFGQYGKIVKAVVNKSHLNTDRANATASAYITFANRDDALSCIIAIDGFYLDGSQLRASFGTTKYCNFFLRNLQCNNPDCLYLHELGDQDDSFTKEEMQTAPHLGKAAPREQSTEIRSGSSFPPPPSRQGESNSLSRSSSDGGASAAPAASPAAAALDTSARRAPPRVVQSSPANSNFPPLSRQGSYSRIVAGSAGSAAESAQAETLQPPPPALPRGDSSRLEERKPNLRVDTSMRSSESASPDSIVGPLEALKLATGSTSQEPAWARPFPSPSVTANEVESDDTITAPPPGGLNPVFSPFGLGFDGGIRGNSHTDDPWSSLGGSTVAPAAPTPTHTNGFGDRPGESLESSGLNGSLSFASIEAIFGQRNESSEALAGLLGVDLSPTPLAHGSTGISSSPKEARGSRFAFANHSDGGDINSAASPLGLVGSSPFGRFNDPAPPRFGYNSGFGAPAPGASTSRFASTLDSSAFPPLGAAPPPSASPFGAPTSQPFGMSNGGNGFSGLQSDPPNSGLAFLQQMLPNVNISFGGEYANGGSGDAWSNSASQSFGASSSGSLAFNDPALVAGPGLAGFYGFPSGSSDDELRASLGQRSAVDH
ncbi:hypothetical protein PINS_up003832 [Pythium insidiosum]|nr:hypothetical protein PINS_up003832 [Pythium insidiosum]